MRYRTFMALAAAALILDVFLVLLNILYSPASSGAAPLAMAAQQHTPAPTRRVAAVTLQPTHTALPTATPSPPPTSTPTPTGTPSPTNTATPTPAPRLLGEHAAAFTPAGRDMRANIDLALRYYQGALNRVYVAPGGVFSFNATLGGTPQRLQWKYVTLKSTAPAPAEGTPAPSAKRIQGGGLCDLASRYVMAARPLLPARAFRFVNHVRSTGIGLRGVPARDAVAIWAVGGQAGEQDLTISNVTDGWLEFVVERNGPKITVRARLWDSLPPE